MTKFTNDFSEEVWRNTYSFGKTDQDKEQTVDETLDRVADALSSVESNPTEWKANFRRILEDFACVPGGRILSNAGTSLSGVTLINCFTDAPFGTDIDSIEGIFRGLTRAAQILKSEGGYGFCADFMRPRGTFIQGVGIDTPGAVEMLELWNTMSKVITAGSGKKKKTKKGKEKIRKGAMMVTMSIWHPDIEEFITKKQTSGTLSKFNMSILICDKFMQAIKNDEKWILEYPDTTFAKYKEEWDGDLYKWKDKQYPVIFYKEFANANELWDLVMESTYNRNEPGVLFIDRINQLNNLNYCENIRTVNPCIVGDTLVAVADGRDSVSIKDLATAQEDVDVYCIDTEGNLKIRTMRNPRITGYNQKIYKVTLDDGTILRCTGNHKFRLLDNTYVQAKELQVGQSLFVMTKLEATFNDIMPKIISTEEDGIEEVYNGTVDEYHNYFIGGKQSKTTYVNTLNCGEQCLPNAGTCLLGSLNLTQFINKDLTDWDYNKLQEYIPIFVRMLDNVNDITSVPLDEHKQNMEEKRRIGIGYMGYASALYMMRKRYGSKEALALTEKLEQFVVNQCYQASALLAKEKGAFPLYVPENYLNSNFLKQALSEETIELIKQHGIRNSHLRSIAPTGNTASLANNVSGGLEPIFLASYYRTSIVVNPPEQLSVPIVDWSQKTYKSTNDWKWVKEGDEDLLLCEFEKVKYKFDQSRGLVKETLLEDYSVTKLRNLGLWPENSQDVDWICDTEKLTLDEHLNTMKVFAKYIDSAISKTFNLPNNYSYESFKALYSNLYDSKTIKGGTSYRAGTMTSVLSATSTKVSEDIVVRRPKEVECDVHHLTVSGQKWIVFVGLVEGRPYEVFAGLMENVCLSKKIKTGKLVKMGRGKYDFVNEDFGEIHDIISVFDNPTEGAITRLLSTSLRHGVELKFLITQLQKTSEQLNTFSKSIARTLKKYIPEGTELSDCTCPSCGVKKLIMVEGCNRCLSCGFSGCS